MNMKPHYQPTSPDLSPRRILIRLGRSSALATLLLAGAAQPADAQQKIGVFPQVQSITSGGNAKTSTDAYEAWLGRPMNYIIQFIPGNNNWTDLTNGGNWFFSGWASQPQSYRDRMVLSVPILPSSGGTGNPTPTLALGASGTYNQHWRDFADMLIAKGYGSCILRLGWEFNGSWYRWTTVGGKGPSFASYWIQIVKSMRYLPDGVTPRPGANFKFCWNPVPGDPSQNGSPMTAFPGTGNQYVDFVGLDVYDTSVTYYKNIVGSNPASYNEHFNSIASGGPALLTASQIQQCRTNAWKANKEWGTCPLDWWSTQVKTSTSKLYNLPICFPEWGLDNILAPASQAGSGGRDDTYFITQFKNWVSNSNNKVDWVAYFEQGWGSSDRNSSICFADQYPSAKALFPTLFGPAVWEAETVTGITASTGDTVSVFNETEASGGAGSKLASNAAADFIQYPLTGVLAGTYTVKVRYKKHTTRGIFQLSIDGVNQGATVDEFGSAAYTEVSLGTKTLTAGTHNFRFTVTGRNTASTGYDLTVDRITLAP